MLGSTMTPNANVRIRSARPATTRAAVLSAPSSAFCPLPSASALRYRKPAGVSRSMMSRDAYASARCFAKSGGLISCASITISRWIGV